MPKIAEHMHASESSVAKTNGSKYRPVLLECLKSYSAATLRADLVEGIIVGIVALPLSLALAIAITIATIQIKDVIGLNVHFERITQLSKPLAGSDGAFVVRNVTETVNGLPEHFHEKVGALFRGFQHTPQDIILHTGIVGVTTV